MLHPRPLVLALLVLGSAVVGPVKPHEESGERSCESDPEDRVAAQYRPGVVTLDGHADDWKDVNGFEFSLLPALDPDAENAYTGGKMTVKALHDGKDMYFMVQVKGEYVYSKGNGNKCPSVALMFQVGDSASYHNMGGCKESPGTCTSKSCRGYEVDIMHFSIGNAVPGRLYGGNTLDNAEGYGGDRNLDGMSPSGFVEGDSPYATSGQKGTYYFEFSRPLRTMDRLQQDVQFSIGQSSKFSAAFWYPVDGNPWHGSGHYTVSCDWVPLDISSGSSALSKSVSGNSWDAASAVALLLSVVSLCLSVFVGYQATRFNPNGYQDARSNANDGL
ncbi:hypothetical protein C3L33_21441, partial [Rhododendron williamsianum]